MLRKLGQKEKFQKPVNTNKAKDKLNLNKPEITIRILKKLTLDKQNPETNFNISKKNILNLSLERLEEEVALVFNLSVVKAKKKIKRILRKLENEPKKA